MNPVVFYHLPKTAGTTLNGVLRQNYKPDEMVECGADTYAFLAELETWPVERRARIRLLQGHFPYGVHELLPQPALTFTMLRDPVDRVVSYYAHARRDPHHYLYNLIHDNHWSLGELLDSGVALMMNDGQTRLLSAIWGEASFGEISDEMLALALNNLRSMSAVGLTEQFDASLRLFQYHFGWRDIRYVRVNVSAGPRRAGDLSPETCDKIRAYNRQDQALYEEAQRQFRQRTREAGLMLRLQNTLTRLGLSHAQLERSDSA